MLSDPGAVLPGHSLPTVSSRGLGLLLWGCCGVFSVPLEKTVIFLTAPEGQNSAALSGLSDEQMRLNTQKTIQPPAVALRGVQPRWRNSDLPGQ